MKYLTLALAMVLAACSAPTAPRPTASMAAVTANHIGSGPSALINDIRCRGRTCTFDGSASHGGASPIVQHWWHFGDGALEPTLGGPVAEHRYDTGGNFIVTLTVVDAAGKQDSRQRSVAVNGPAPR